MRAQQYRSKPRQHVFVDQDRPVVVGAAMNNAMADRDKIDVLGLAQPICCARNRRRDIDTVRCVMIRRPAAIRQMLRRAAAAATPMPSICPLTRRRRAYRVPKLKDLKLDTRGARVDDQNSVHAAHAAVMLADLRRAAA